MRHDIEFSIERAYNLSLVESENGFYSTYFVQITNNFYNAFSLKNMILLKQMIDNGHQDVYKRQVYRLHTGRADIYNRRTITGEGRTNHKNRSA